MKIYNYLLDHDEDPELSVIGAVSSDYSDALAAVEAADKHEHYITGEINKIYAEALKAKDYAAVLFLNWFIEEQEEEEQNSGEMIRKIKMLGKDAHAMYLLDKELAERK